jgi:hypothetical protein
MPWASSSLPQAACEEDAPTVPRISSAANATVVRSISTRGGRGSSWCCRHSAPGGTHHSRRLSTLTTTAAAAAAAATTAAGRLRYDDDFPFLPDQKPSESIAENASDSESELD